jgi:glycosyltransferase involved in cell wall biosynthesis
MKNELVSVTVPTYNSEKTLEQCLKLVKEQTYKNIEIIIIDSYSKDKTLEIAKKFKARIVMCKGKLLEARIDGAKASKGKYVLLLDSDQMLERTVIERAVEKMKEYDSLWFWERAYNRKKWIPSLYDADRMLVQTYWEPDEDIVLPRFFKRELLIKAYNKIPKKDGLKYFEPSPAVLAWAMLVYKKTRNLNIFKGIEIISSAGDGYDSPISRRLPIMFSWNDSDSKIIVYKLGMMSHYIDATVLIDSIPLVALKEDSDDLSF